MRPTSRPAKVGAITVRTAVITAAVFVIGAAAGALTYLASRSLPQALLAAGTAVGGTANLLAQIAGTSPDREIRDQDGSQHDDQDESARQQET